MQKMEDPFIFAVKEELGDRFTVNVEVTYRATIQFILAQLLNEVDNYQTAKMTPNCQSAW